MASMCGTNLGDLFPDVFGFNTASSLIALLCFFLAIALTERYSRNGGEPFYWMLILVVRAAATNIADFSFNALHLSFGSVAIAFAGVLALVVGLHTIFGTNSTIGGLPPTNATYWITMLIAGALGTIIGDGVGHLFSSMQVGVPISAGISTFAVALILGVRSRMAWTSGAIYWLAIVMVRWWGTSVGDISAFLLSLPVSIGLTALVLLLTLVLWPEPVATRKDENLSAVA